MRPRLWSLILLVLVALTASARADDPCPFTPPPGTIPINMENFSLQALPRPALDQIHSFLPPSFRVTANQLRGYRDPGGSLVLFLLYDNLCCTEAAYQWEHRLAIVEQSLTGDISIFAVVGQDGSQLRNASEINAVFKRGSRTYFVATGFSRGACAPFLITKLGTNYLSAPIVYGTAPTEANYRQLQEAASNRLGPFAPSRSATDVFGPSAVWKPTDQVLRHIAERCYSGASGSDQTECTTSQMKAANARPQAIAATRLLRGGEYVTGFRETGRVDVLTVSEFVYNSPELSNQDLLVNGDPRIFAPCRLAGQIDIRQAAEYRELSKRFPKMEPMGPCNFRTILPLPNNGQRFVFGFTLLNGCRACELAGAANIAFDFDGSGKYTGLKVMNLQGP